MTDPLSSDTTPISPGGEEAVPAPPTVVAGLSGKVARGVRWNVLDQVFQQGARTAVTVVLTKLIAPEGFGLVAMALVVTQVSSFISDGGFGPALVQRRDLERRHVDSAFTATALLGIVLGAGLALGAPVIASFFHEPELRSILVVLSIVFVAKGIHCVPLEMLRRALLFDRVVVMSSIATVLAGVVGVTMAFAGAGVWALVAYSVAESVGAAVAVCFLAWKSGEWHPGIGLDRGALGEMAGFSGYVTGFRLLYYAVGNTDNAIVGRVLGATALGYYGLAYRVMLFPIQRVADVIMQVTFPAFSALQGETARLREAYLRSVQAISLLCFPATVAIVITAPLLVPLVFGPKWTPAVGAVQILGLNGPRIAIGRLNGSVYLAGGKPKWEFWLAVVGFGVALVSFLIGVQFGINGVAFGFTIAGWALTPVGLRLCGKVLGTTLGALVKNVVPMIIGTVAMVVVALGTEALLGSSGPLTRLVAMSVTGALAYAAAVQLSAPGLIKGVAGALAHRG